jgi:hypothetical protein
VALPTQIKSERIIAFAHCVDPFCPGNQQQPVDADRIEDGITFHERGGDLGAFENTYVRVQVVDETALPCPHCGRVREVVEQQRPEYMPISGHAQDGLLRYEHPDQYKQVETPEQRVQRLREELERAETEAGQAA